MLPPSQDNQPTVRCTGWSSRGRDSRQELLGQSERTEDNLIGWEIRRSSLPTDEQRDAGRCLVRSVMQHP